MVLPGTRREREVLGGDHPDTLLIVSSMGNMFWRQKKYDEALERYRRVLTGREKSLGEDHPSTLFTVYAMAAVCLDQGNGQEALELHRRALASRERPPRKGNPRLLSVSREIAERLQKEGLE